MNLSLQDLGIPKEEASKVNLFHLVQGRSEAKHRGIDGTWFANGAEAGVFVDYPSEICTLDALVDNLILAHPLPKGRPWWRWICDACLNLAFNFGAFCLVDMAAMVPPSKHGRFALTSILAWCWYSEFVPFGCLQNVNYFCFLGPAWTKTWRFLMFKICFYCCLNVVSPYIPLAVSSIIKLHFQGGPTLDLAGKLPPSTGLFARVDYHQPSSTRLKGSPRSRTRLRPGN